jgi:hypothetical protein
LEPSEVTRREVLLLLAAGLLASSRGLQAGSGVQKQGERKVNPFPPHPGIIRMVDMYDKSVRELRASEAPERVRFVYIDKDGREVDANQNPVERIPVVEVQMIPLDRNGNIVPKETATTIRRKEFGPDHRPLRSSTLSKQ